MSSEPESGPLIFNGDFSILKNGGFHRAWIKRVGKLLQVGIDRQQLAPFPEAAFFDANQETYFQLGTEVFEPGDSASGSVRNVKLNGSSYIPKCGRSDRGVSFTRVGSAFSAVGKYVPNRSSYWTDAFTGEASPFCEKG